MQSGGSSRSGGVQFTVGVRTLTWYFGHPVAILPFQPPGPEPEPQSSPCVCDGPLSKRRRTGGVVGLSGVSRRGGTKPTVTCTLAGFVFGYELPSLVVSPAVAFSSLR